MRSWLVAGGLVLTDEGLLLVQNRRRDGRVDWSPPGGVIDPTDASLLDGLTREVAEETGLVVARWRGPVYEITAEAPGLGWHLRVEAYLAEDVSGDVRPGDPDGIVVDARWVPPGECAAHLCGAQPWVVEPLTAWLDERWVGSRSFDYEIHGDHASRLEVRRR